MSKNNGQILPYSVSQNFLTGRRTIDLLLQKTDLCENDLVLEIGAGKGHITRALAGVCHKVRTYEIDKTLAGKLAPKLPPNVCLITGDFLRSALPKTPYKVFANIPFSRTTEIIRKLTEAENPPDAMWLIMEKGAAMRFCGLPRETKSSLQIKPYFDVKIVHRLRREDFHPAPRVDCVLMEFRRKPQPDLPPAQRAAFAAFVEKAKRLGVEKLLTKKQIATALRLSGLPQIGPSGDMLYVQWLCLFRCLLQFGQRGR